MTRDVISLSEEQDFSSADQIMRLRHVRHLPVVRGNKLVGLVTHRDLMRGLARLGATEPTKGTRHVSFNAKDIMTTELIKCPPGTHADDAARIMTSRKIGCVLVTSDADELLGIITEADIAAWAIEMMAKQKFDSTPAPRR